MTRTPTVSDSTLVRLARLRLSTSSRSRVDNTVASRHLAVDVRTYLSDIECDDVRLFMEGSDVHESLINHKRISRSVRRLFMSKPDKKNSGDKADLLRYSVAIADGAHDAMVSADAIGPKADAQRAALAKKSGNRRSTRSGNRKAVGVAARRRGHVRVAGTFAGRTARQAP